MSSINKLAIRGIRSFSPESEETIEFYSPLTMIVGANGCGKTTLIESLKFVCTGSLPPNAKRYVVVKLASLGKETNENVAWYSGQSLVNDPGMTDTAEVKASIKLLFQNRSGKTCVATRSLQVTKKRTKLEFKAVDGVLKLKKDSGETVSTSMKCSDMDRVIPENLGVSPAILENVIFVHQEDSNWPMQEGKILKTKFDDIFESTRYTKALEAFTKCKKETQSKAKTLKAELMELGAHLMAATQSKKELEEAQRAKEQCDEELETIGQRLQQNEERLLKVNELLTAAQASMQRLKKLEWQVAEADRRVQEKTNSLESVLPDSDEQLQHVLNNFEMAMASKRKDLQSLHQQMDAVTMETDKIRAELDRLNLRKGQAVALQEQLQAQRDQQWRLIGDLAKRFAFLAQVHLTGGWNAAVVKDVISRLQSEYQRFQQESGRDVGRLRDVVTAMEKTAGEKRAHMQSLEIELKLKTEETRALQQECNTKRVELSRVAASRGNIQRCQLEFDSAQQAHQEFMADYNRKIDDIRRQIKETSDRMRNLQDELNQDAQLLQELSHHRKELAAAEANIQQAEADVRLAQTELASLMATNRDVLLNVLPVDTPIQRTEELEEALKVLDTRTVSLQSQRDHAREEISRLRSELAAKDAVLSQHTRKLQDLRGRIEGLSNVEQERDRLIQRLNELRRNRVLIGSELDPVPYAVTFEELIMRAKETEDEAREMLTITKASKAFLKRLNKERKRNPSACPCCGQQMNPTVVSTYERNVTQLLKFGDEPDDQPEVTLEEYNDTLEQASALFLELQTMQKRLMPAMEIRTEIAQLERLVQEMHTDKRTKQTELHDWETVRLVDSDLQVQTMGRVHRAFQDICLRWKNADQRRGEYVDRKKRQTDSLFSGADMGGRSLEDIEALQRSRQETKDNLQVKKDRLATEETTLSKRFYTVKQQVAEAEKALTDAKLEGNRYEELETTLQQLQTKMAEIESRRHALQRDRDQADRDVREFQVQVTAKQQELRTREEDHHRQGQALQREQDTLHQSQQTIEQLAQRVQHDATMNVTDIEASIARCQQEITQREEDKQRTFLPRIQALSAEVASQEHIKRNVLGNIELRAIIVEARQLRDEWQQLQQATSSVNGSASATQQQYQQAEREQAVVLREKATLTSERDTLKGRVDVYRVNVQQIERRLQETSYRNIDERYRRKNIEYETTNMAVTDLDNYLNALDRALQSFHTMKIRSINKIIRELWQQIYQGQDIDTIEIESGADLGDGEMGTTAATTAAASAAGSSATSRSYNYRVVMKKGDLPLDMRGRCSAGQKVLAAIVIRLALAETFCNNCGILALDEPTTNLDDPNKAGLAQALARLIASRAGQVNFQLVCITHDEDFVRMMRNELALTNDANLPAYYFRVYREEKGHTGKFFSHIDRIPWEDM